MESKVYEELLRLAEHVYYKEPMGNVFVLQKQVKDQVRRLFQAGAIDERQADVILKILYEGTKDE